MDLEENHEEGDFEGPLASGRYKRFIKLHQMDSYNISEIQWS